ncbi:MAG: ATP-dependent zinc metalloprotease FtsH, partial [Planctomycetota bacterium]|jgi:cell division protease FtsH
LPTEEKYLMSHSDLLARITVSMGGRAAEELVYGEVSTGAGNDLEVATRMARAMVKQFGMSDKMGPVSLDEAQQQGGWEGLGKGRAFSEQTAREVDVEVKIILDECADRAERLLRDHRTCLDAMQRALMEQETLGQDEVARIVEEYTGKKPVVVPESMPMDDGSDDELR